MTDKKRKGFSLRGLGLYYIISGIIAVLLIIIIIFINNRMAEISSDDATVYDDVLSDEVSETGPKITGEPEKEISVETVKDPVIEKPVSKKADMVFVIDDVGNSLNQLEKFLKLPYPVTFAIMPDRKYTRESAAMIEKAGKDYILHQPMEALNGSDPGSSAIYRGMNREKIHDILEHNFKQLPGAKGMNNHMGSAATSDAEVMDAVMEYLSDNNLFFLDSYTISSSLAEEAAQKHKVSYIKRNSMFLDNEKDNESIQNAINEGRKAAGKKGHAVMIGHVMSTELAESMLELYPDFIEDGFTLKEISELFVEMNAPPDKE